MSELRIKEFRKDLDFSELHNWAISGDVVLIKNFLKDEETRALRSQLHQWRNSTPSHEPTDYYPKSVLNLHIDVTNQTTVKRESGSIDYHELYTNFSLYNYRIGDMHQPLVKEHIPIIQSIGPQILDLFYKVLEKPDLVHGRHGEKNLYFEIVHFPCGAGYIEEHTHETILDYGQPINMVTALTKKERDFDGGGLFIRPGNKVFDLTREFDIGDSIFFRNDIPHWVTPVTGSDQSHYLPDRGRWSLTMFYY